MAKELYEYPRVETMVDNKPVVKRIGMKTIEVLRVRDVDTSENERESLFRLEKSLFGFTKSPVMYRQVGTREVYVLQDDMFVDIKSQKTTFLELNGWQNDHTVTKRFSEIPRYIREIFENQPFMENPEDASSDA
jgi:hypothetical protein